MDLEKLGATMQERRTALGIPRAVVARRIGVSPSYLWMLEEAKPRASGEPSRPSRALLQSWGHALGLDEEGTVYVMSLADYEAQDHGEGQARTPNEDQRRLRAERQNFLHQPRGIVAARLTTALARTLQDAATLDDDSWDEVVASAGSMIEWLGFKARRASRDSVEQ